MVVHVDDCFNVLCNYSYVASYIAVCCVYRYTVAMCVCVMCVQS